ncbi:uncharacterized protein LOC121764141 [Salvia splendens]|uniref:uncharacterized protein LOC121764141 n=1 Tax=Salvia splendens TaxID=180675 RepID=UPI001C25FE04|nr:uncharacterized protein LOC121764141 [Salvia splendens]
MSHCTKEETSISKETNRIIFPGTSENSLDLPATINKAMEEVVLLRVSLKSEEVYQNPSASSPSPTNVPNHEESPESIAFDQVAKEGESSALQQVTEKGRMVEAESVAVVIQPSDLPPKKTDPGVFTLPISIRNIRIEHAMCDLGASINIMPYSIYEKLGETKLVKTGMMIQLADGSCIHLEGILEDEIVKVNKFKYPADFFVMKMTEPGAEESTGVLLGRAVRKPQDNESKQSVDTITPWEQGYLGNELFKRPPTDSIEDEQLKKEAVEWFDATMTGEMDDQAIERAIMDFYKPPRPAEITQPARVEKPPDQADPLRGMLKENPSPTRQLLSIPTSPVTLKSLSNQTYQKPVNQIRKDREDN